MNIRLATVIVALALISFPSSAAIQYDYSQKNTSDDSVTPVSELSARAIIDGNRTRVDFLAGNSYPPGTYMVTTDGSRLFFVDPTNKWYTEHNLSSATAPLASRTAKISNFRSKVESRDDRPVIAGLQTSHFTLTLTYDMTVTMRSIPLTQNIRTTVDVWTTDRYPELMRNAYDGSLQTGDPEIDRLIGIESGKIHGFPLRQVLSIQATFDAPRGSQLKVPSTRTILRETWVTALRETSASPADFIIPAAFRRADTSDLPESATSTLTFDPPSK